MPNLITICVSEAQINTKIENWEKDVSTLFSINCEVITSLQELTFNNILYPNLATNVVCFSQTLQTIHSMDGKLVFTYHGQKHLKVGKWTPGIDFAKFANGRLIKLVVK